MSKRNGTLVGLLMLALLFGGMLPAMADDVDAAFDALKTYEWGADRAALGAIDAAVAASHDDKAAQKAIEARLAAVLKTDVHAAAKDFVCRKLSLVGSADSVPAVAALLTDKKFSSMARFALERMPCDEAVAAVRAALPKATGRVKIGLVNTLGVRRDAESTKALAALLKDSDQEIVAAAAAALGSIGTSDTAKVLKTFQADAPEELQLQAADAYLVCAEQLLADKKTSEAKMIYISLNKPELPKHVRLAAMRGLLSTAGK